MGHLGPDEPKALIENWEKLLSEPTFAALGWKLRFVTLPGSCLHGGHAATCMAAAVATDSRVDVSPWKK